MIIKDAVLDFGGKYSKKFAHDRTKTVGASEIGQCARRVRWSKIEPSAPGNRSGWGAALRGNFIEDQLWYPAMKAAYGQRLIYAGPQQTTFVEGTISATPDGLVQKLTAAEKKEIGTKANEVLVECKSIDPRVNLTEEKRENHFQVQVQLGLIRKKTKFRPTHAIISYINASFVDDITEFVVEYDHSLFGRAQERADMIMAAPSAEKLKPEGIIAGKKECNYCPYFERCGMTRRDLVPDFLKEASPKLKTEIIKLAKMVKKLRENAKASEQSAKSIEQEMREKLGVEGVRSIENVVRWSTFGGRSSYDMVAMKAAAEKLGLDIEQFKKSGTPGDQFSILL